MVWLGPMGDDLRAMALDQGALRRDMERVQGDLERAARYLDDHGGLLRQSLQSYWTAGGGSHQLLQQIELQLREERERRREMARRQEQEHQLEKLRRHLRETLTWEYVDSDQVISSGPVTMGTTECACHYRGDGFETCSNCQPPESKPKSSPRDPLPWDNNKHLTDEDRAWLQRQWEPTKNLPPGPWVTTELIR